MQFETRMPLRHQANIQPTIELCVVALQVQEKSVLTLVEEAEEVAVTSVGAARGLRTIICPIAALPVHLWSGSPGCGYYCVAISERSPSYRSCSRSTLRP